MAHSFNPEFALRYGVHEAIIIQYISYWIQRNKVRNINNHEEHTWTYSSITGLCQTFTYLTRKQIWSALDNLLTKGILLKRRYNKTGYDRTNWYCFVEEEKFIQISEPVAEQAETEAPRPFSLQGKSIFPTGEMEFPSEENGVSLQEQPIPLYIHSNTSHPDDIPAVKKIATKPPTIPFTSTEERKAKFKDKIDDYRFAHPQKYPIAIYMKFYDWWTEPSKNDERRMRHETETEFDIELRLYNFWKKISEKDRQGYWHLHEDWLLDCKRKKEHNPVNAIIKNLTRNTQPELFLYQQT